MVTADPSLRGHSCAPMIRPWYLMWLMEVADSGCGEVDSGGGNRCSHEGSQLHAGISIGGPRKRCNKRHGASNQEEHVTMSTLDYLIAIFQANLSAACVLSSEGLVSPLSCPENV